MPEEDSLPAYNKCPRLLVLFLAETLGTAMLLFFGCMGVCVSIVELPVVPHLPGISFGLTVMFVIQVIGHISGAHLNPQISLSAVILGKMKLVDFAVYILAQFIGGILGFGLLKLLTPAKYGEGLCTTLLQRNVHISQGLVIEIVITSALCFVLGAVLDARNAHKTDSIPLRFGLTVSCLSMVAGPYTGASMNTARSFAPALLNNIWKDHWIYWLGPTLGAVFASVFYRYILEPPIQ